MGSIRRATRRLPASIISALLVALSAAPLSAAAAGAPSVDSLWNRPQGLQMDSAFYAIQSWWDRYNRQVSDDPSQRGIDELSQANSDLLNAYVLLQHEHQSAQPVAIIDPLLAGIYDAITGSTVKAPLGALFGGINQGLLNMEGRASSSETVKALLQDYRAKQAVAVRDLHARAGSAYDSLLASNGQREADFLAQVQEVSAPADEVQSLLADAGRQTSALVKQHGGNGLTADTHGTGHVNGSGNGKANGGSGGSQGNTKSQGKVEGKQGGGRP